MSKYRLNEKEKELVNFACDICLKKHCKKHNVDWCACAWQSFDNEYCPEIINKIEELRAQNDR